MIEAYLIGVAIFAVLYGFQTPFNRGRDAADKYELIVTVLSWPIGVLAGFGEACRCFSKKRHAEDVSRGAPPFPQAGKGADQ